MTTLKRFYNYSYDRRISAISMDPRFILIGQTDGRVSVHYLYNGVRAFESQVSDSSISAVCCEDHDDIHNEIFYVADNKNKLFVLNKKGRVLAVGELEDEMGKVNTIVNQRRFVLLVHTCLGSVTFKFNQEFQIFCVLCL